MPNQCKICNATLFRMSRKHAALHGMTLEEYHEKFNLKTGLRSMQNIGSGNRVDELLYALKNMMLSGEALPTEMEQMVETILKDPEVRFRSVLAAITLEGVGRIPALTKILDNVSDRLIESVDLDTAKPSELLRIWQIASEEKYRTVELVKSLSETPTSGLKDPSLSLSITNTSIPQDPATRAAMGAIINHFIQAAEAQKAKKNAIIDQPKE